MKSLKRVYECGDPPSKKNTKIKKRALNAHYKSLTSLLAVLEIRFFGGTCQENKVHASDKKFKFPSPTYPWRTKADMGGTKVDLVWYPFTPETLFINFRGLWESLPPKVLCNYFSGYENAELKNFLMNICRMQILKEQFESSEEGIVEDELRIEHLIETDEIKFQIKDILNEILMRKSLFDALVQTIVIEVVDDFFNKIENHSSLCIKSIYNLLKIVRKILHKSKEYAKDPITCQQVIIDILETKAILRNSSIQY
jgi:hypothetical protein